MANGGARPGAGRPKGALAKASERAQEKLEAIGCDPLESLAEIAREALQDAQMGYDTLVKQISDVKGDDEKIMEVVQGYLKNNLALRTSSLHLAKDCFKELAQYQAPKLKAVEHSQSGDFVVMLSNTKGLPVAGDQASSETESGA